MSWFHGLSIGKIRQPEIVPPPEGTPPIVPAVPVVVPPWPAVPVVPETPPFVPAAPLVPEPPLFPAPPIVPAVPVEPDMLDAHPEETPTAPRHDASARCRRDRIGPPMVWPHFATSHRRLSRAARTRSDDLHRHTITPPRARARGTPPGATTSDSIPASRCRDRSAWRRCASTHLHRTRPAR